MASSVSLRPRSRSHGPTETEPLLRPRARSVAAREAGDDDGGSQEEGTFGEDFDSVPQAKRQLGLVSAAFLIFNRVIGTGIYATSSLILRCSGSVGMSFVMWILGALIAAAGTAVYIELGTGLPRSGGEKNYLEFIYRRPKYLATCVYATFVLFAGMSSANAIAFGEYILNAFSLPITRWNSRLLAVFVLTVASLLHAVHLKLGLRIQNALGFFMFFVLSAIALSGVFSLLSVPGFQLPDDKKTHNFDPALFWQGTRFEWNGFVTGMYSVIWAFIGYSNANYALSEVKDPVRTIKRAAPLAMTAVTAVYLLVNVAYFAVVSKAEILDGGRIVAALFFRNLFGPATEKILSVVIALSVFGNILAVVFTHGRVIQELGREGVVPFSGWLASNKPFDSPFSALAEQWLFNVLFAVAPPPGDAYNFMINASSYPYSVINALLSFGLLYLRTPSAHRAGLSWAPPFNAWSSAVLFFLFSNVFLTIVPLIPPSAGTKIYDNLPYWSHVAVVLAIVALGALYWYVWAVVLPRRGGYALVQETAIQEDGVSRTVFGKKPHDAID